MFWTRVLIQIQVLSKECFGLFGPTAILLSFAGHLLCSGVLNYVQKLIKTAVGKVAANVRHLK